jgi:ABC-type Zn uptake system ZnuABC Zn-binding protein ZnuA
MIGSRALLIGAAAALLATSAYAEPVRVVATVHPLAAIALAVGGDAVEVATLLPPGASPHAYDPVPSDMVRLSQASVFVGVGGGLDSWADRLRAVAESTPTVVILTQLAGRNDAHDHDHDHGGGHHDEPHLWLDPLFVADTFVPALVRAFTSADGITDAEAEAIKNRARGLGRELHELDRRIRAKLAGTGSTEYIAFHNAWGPFAERYDLVELGVLEEAGGEEPTPRAIAGLIRAARAQAVRAILIEPQLPARVAEIIAAEFDGTTVLVDPIGSPLDAGRTTYVELMEYNANAFAHALALGERVDNRDE